MKLGVPGKGLLTSEGYEAERGVWRVGLLGLLLSSGLVSMTEGADVLRAAILQSQGKEGTNEASDLTKERWQRRYEFLAGRVNATMKAQEGRKKREYISRLCMLTWNARRLDEARALLNTKDKCGA